MDVVHEEEHIILQSAQADLNYFAPIYSRYSKRIYAYCLSRLHHEADAQDITSQVFVQAMLNIERFRGGSVRAWLFSIAHNLMIDHFRKNRRIVDLDTQEIYEWDTEPIERIIRSENEALLRELIHRLPADKQNMLLLRFVGGLSAREIGEIVDKNETHVRVEIHRILKELRRQVTEMEQG